MKHIMKMKDRKRFELRFKAYPQGPHIMIYKVRFTLLMSLKVHTLLYTAVIITYSLPCAIVASVGERQLALVKRIKVGM